MIQSYLSLQSKPTVQRVVYASSIGQIIAGYLTEAGKAVS
ncbi:hypothetical protein CLOSTMETH_00457 [[Clostridium] methylpentosum DSM 5476]|uniref:Uncharacterized protein n=1 Tax=[Clostridium] methylpentosum DSM 5476 TaxID=537013 RepID=C0E9F8_9FIRM|nr:hypothetical protein CLOSTMETH_00457 [[Clostridium] methylpentosum DSM 5476]